MKLKYYLRGLGIGIIVTALLLGFSNKEGAKASANNDVEEINEVLSHDIEVVLVDKNKEELNANETKTSYNNVDQSEEDTTKQFPKETIQADITEENGLSGENDELLEENVSDNEELATIQGAIMEETDNEDEQLPDEVKALLEQNEVFVLEIIKGDDSGTVSRKLYNAGLVDNASQFDAFLTQHGYDKKIRVGKKKIPKGSTWMEIAQKISNN